jgi:hypothetical protein
MNLEDTVRYSCDSGEVMIVFANKDKNGPKSPFSEDQETVIGDGVNTVSKEGSFECHCSVKGSDGQFHGWKTGSPESGGEHNVPPNQP